MASWDSALQASWRAEKDTPAHTIVSRGWQWPPHTHVGQLRSSSDAASSTCRSLIGHAQRACRKFHLSSESCHRRRRQECSLQGPLRFWQNSARTKMMQPCERRRIQLKAGDVAGNHLASWWLSMTQPSCTCCAARCCSTWSSHLRQSVLALDAAKGKEACQRSAAQQSEHTPARRQ